MNNGGNTFNHEGPPALSPWGGNWSVFWYWTGHPEEYSLLLDQEERLRVVERNADFIIYENLDFTPFVKAYDRVFFVPPKDIINQTLVDPNYTTQTYVTGNQTLSNDGGPVMWNSIIYPGRVGKLFPTTINGVIVSLDFYIRENSGSDQVLNVSLSSGIGVNSVASFNVTIPANQQPDWLNVPVNLEWHDDMLFVSWFVHSSSAMWGFDAEAPYDDFYCADLADENCWTSWDDRPWVRVNMRGDIGSSWTPKTNPLNEWYYETVLASSSKHLIDKVPGFDGVNLMTSTTMLPFNASVKSVEQFLSIVDGVVLMGDLVETDETRWVAEHPLLLSLYEAESSMVPSRGLWIHTEGSTFSNNRAAMVNGSGAGSMMFFAPRNSYYDVAFRVKMPPSFYVEVDGEQVGLQEFSIDEDEFRWLEADAGLLQKGWHNLSISVDGARLILDQIVMLSNIEAPIGLEQISSSSNPQIVMHEDNTALHKIKIDSQEPFYVLTHQAYNPNWSGYIIDREVEHYSVPLQMYWANIYYVDSPGQNTLEILYTPQQRRNNIIAIWVAAWLASIIGLAYFSNPNKQMKTKNTEEDRKGGTSMFNPNRLGYNNINTHHVNYSPHGEHVKILKYVPKNSRVLDVGCSSGYLSKEFKDRHCHVVGIEISEALAQSAKRHCDQVLVGDVEKMNFPFSSNSFDVVVIADVLEHLKRPDLILAKLGRFLSPSGIVIASIPNVAQVRIRLKLLAGRFEYKDCGILDLTHLRFFTLDSIKQLFAESGYEIIKIDYTGWASILKVLPKWLALQFIIVAQPKIDFKDTA